MPSDARLTLYAYLESRELAAADPSFYALIAAAMRRADTFNLARLVAAFPLVYEDLDARYNEPGGRLPGDPPDPPAREVANDG